MPKASPIRSAFNAGELSPLVEGRVDVAKYQNGTRVCENFIPSVQGPAVRRPGTRYVAEVKTSSKRTWLWRFEFNVTQSFILEFGHLYIRFYTNHGQVQSGGSPYEIVSPYSEADLTDTDGTFMLDMVQTGDVIYIAHPSYPLKKLSRLGNTNWTIANADFVNGPFKDQNTDKSITVYASATTGSVTLTASSPIFQAGHVGALFYIEPKDLSQLKPWASAQELSKGPSGVNVYGIIRRSEGKTYKCVTSASASGVFNGQADYPNVIRTGGNKPIHTYGIVPDGDGSSKSGTVVQREGVDWEFVDNGWGYCKITAVAGDGLSCTATVIDQLPSDVVYVASGATKTVTAMSQNVSGKIRLTIASHGYSNGQFVTVDLTYRYSNGMPEPVTLYQSKTTTGTFSLYVIDANTIDIDCDFPPASYTTTTGSGLAEMTYTWTYDSFTSGASTLSSTGGGSPTFRWAMGALNGVDGYPSKVTFFRERLALAKGQELFFSVTGDFENFAAVDEAGDIVADRAIKVTISSDDVNRVEWLVPTQALIAGTAGQEFACSENSTNEAFAPANVKIAQQSSDGSRGVKPVRVGYSTLFVQRSGRKLKEIAYNFQQDGYVTNDMTVLAEHITAGGIIDMAWHREPYVALWAVRADGKLLGFTFNKEQEVIGWHRHQLGGNGIVESVVVIPAPDKTRDELWMIVRRTIGGVTKRYVEYMEAEYTDGMSPADAYYVDAGVTYDGTATTSITGLTWLAGQTVQILADGATHPDVVVSSGGAITLQRSASKVQIGLGYESTLQTNRIEAGAGDGTAQGKTKRINKVVVRFYNTLGGFAGPDETNLDEIQFRKGSDPMNQAPPLFTGDKLIEWPDGYTFDGYVMIQQVQPLPMTIVAIMPQVHTFDR